MSRCPTPDGIQASAEANGVPVDAETATRISRSIGSAFEGFAKVSGTLPMDLEPATYVVAQREAKR